MTDRRCETDGSALGGQGAGKSTVARGLAPSLDLPLHPIDLWTYDHAARLNQADTLDEELARGLGSVPAVVEGPQLLVSLANDHQ